MQKKTTDILTKTIDNAGKSKSPRFAFLKISAIAHWAHPAQSGKSQIFPALIENQRIYVTFDLS
jgi:hypothetical protein